MTTSNEPILPIGFRAGYVFELNASGSPAAVDTTAYEGIALQGPKGLALNLPEPRRIPHAGEDRLIAVDQLPSQEPIVGEIATAALHFEMDALVSNVTQFTVAEAKMIARGTDQQGNEPIVALLAFQQVLGKISGARRWHFHMIPSTRAIPLIPGFSDNTDPMRYSIAPNPSTKHLWETALSLSTEGATSGAILSGYTEFKPKVVSFLGDGTEDNFLFPLDAQAVTPASKIAVWVDGALQSSGVTYDSTGITFSVAPASNKRIVVFYEHA